MSTAACLPRLNISAEALEQFCRKWKIVRLEAFGSILRDDFGPDSDIDLLVTFADDANWSLIDHMRMETELESKLARPVDILTRHSIEQSPNWIRRKAILANPQLVYTV